VAKNPLAIADRFVPVLRGRSRKPLWVSSINMPVQQAADLIAGMRGDHRLPVLVKMADQAARECLAAMHSGV
jgi:deoxyribonuclease V